MNEPTKDKPGLPAQPDESVLREAAGKAVERSLRGVSGPEILAELRETGLDPQTAAMVYTRARLAIKRTRARSAQMHIGTGLLWVIAFVVALVLFRFNLVGPVGAWGRMARFAFGSLCFGLVLLVIGIVKWRRLSKL